MPMELSSDVLILIGLWEVRTDELNVRNSTSYTVETPTTSRLLFYDKTFDNK